MTLGASVAMALGLLGCSAPPPTSNPPVVAEVIDGDTIIVDFTGSRERIRLLGVDTPETSDPNRPVQCFGREATDFVSELLPQGTPVRVERDTQARDHFGRLLLYVYRAEDDLFVNHELLRHGYADLAIYAPNDAHEDLLDAAYTSARTQVTGLWRACGGADVALDPPALAPSSGE